MSSEQDELNGEIRFRERLILEELHGELVKEFVGRQLTESTLYHLRSFIAHYLAVLKHKWLTCIDMPEDLDVEFGENPGELTLTVGPRMQNWIDNPWKIAEND